MIEELTVRNIGGIGSASLRLGRGLTVLTGESGSGKSSLVRSLELLAGKRGQAAFLRAGQEEGSVEAFFTFEGGRKPSLLSDEEEEDSLCARRILSRSGRNRTSFQGRLVPLSLFSSVMNESMRIQSQFAQIELLDPARQLEIVDFCGGAEGERLRAELSRTFSEALQCDRDLRAGKAKEAELKKRFQDGESILAAASSLRLTPGCDLQWEREWEELSRRVEKGRRMKDMLLRITGGASGTGALDTIENAGLQLLQEMPERNPETEELFNDGLSSLQQFIRLIGEQNSENALNEMEREGEALEKRIGLLRKLKRSAGTATAEEFLRWAEEAREAADWLRREAARSALLAEKARELRKEASRLAMELRTLRIASASALEERVNGHLADLAMGEIRFSVCVRDLGKIRTTGADEILFTLSGKGREEIPVNKSASGGELSRILLALQLSLPDDTIPATLAFDEVEAGLGGKAAVLAGYKLVELSKKCQVLLVTHEATIAALADHHFQVRKSEKGVSVCPLSPEERVGEIARMLSGDPSLPEAREHARSLLTL